MAERRMFAKSIVLSDAFLDMPLSARCLYFTLGMLADDDGFVGSPKAIMRQCGASQDDLVLLLQKRYLLSFESGVIVIKHWRMNNYLQNDRHKPTTYLEELDQLIVDERGAYTEAAKIEGSPSMYTECIQNVYKMDTQDRIGKDSIGKNSIDDDIYIYNYNKGGVEDVVQDPIEIESDQDVVVNVVDHIIDLFNQICKSYDQETDPPKAIFDGINSRLLNYTVEDFETLFKKAEASPFLKGGGDRGWKADLKWLLGNMSQVLDGKYDDWDSDKKAKPRQQASKKKPNPLDHSDFKQSYDFDELEKTLISN